LRRRKGREPLLKECLLCMSGCSGLLYSVPLGLYDGKYKKGSSANS